MMYWPLIFQIFAAFRFILSLLFVTLPLLLCRYQREKEWKWQEKGGRNKVVKKEKLRSPNCGMIDQWQMECRHRVESIMSFLVSGSKSYRTAPNF